MNPNANSRPRVVAIGYGVFGTGLTRVMHTILSGLADRYEIHQIGLGYHGPPTGERYRLLPCNLKGGDLYGVFQGIELIEELQPDIVFILHVPVKRDTTRLSFPVAILGLLDSV